MKLPRILIGAPQAKAKDYAMEEWIENIRFFSYPKDKISIFLADNSDTDEYAAYISEKYKINVVWNAPQGRGILERMAESHNYVRDHALKYNYDYLLHLETDVFPPHDVIQQLLWTHKKIVSALYHIRGLDGVRHIMAQEVEPHPTMVAHNVITHTAGSCYFVDGTVKQVFHAGLGCMLLHRSILNEFTFRFDEKIDAHPDTFFAKDMYVRGMPVYIHTGVFCEHKNYTAWDKGVMGNTKDGKVNMIA